MLQSRTTELCEKFLIVFQSFKKIALYESECYSGGDLTYKFAFIYIILFYSAPTETLDDKFRLCRKNRLLCFLKILLFVSDRIKTEHCLCSLESKERMVLSAGDCWYGTRVYNTMYTLQFLTIARTYFSIC